MFMMRMALTGRRRPCTEMIWGFLAGIMALGFCTASGAQTLDRIRGASAIKLGYETDARPFSFKNESGTAEGYAVGLCTRIADQVKSELGLSELSVEWVPLTPDQRFQAVQDGSVDLLCGADAVTLARRKDVSFSISIFPSGTGAVVNADAPLPLREVLAHGRPSERPVWRGSPARTVLEEKTFSAVTGTTSDSWLNERIKTFQLAATVVPVETYDQGIERVLDGSSDVLFGDLPLLLDAAARNKASGNLIVLDRHFTYEPMALALARGDEDFRLTVDRALSGIYRSEDFRGFFTQWFGPPDESIVTFFQQTALPE
jgi:polar amino acid transport system substrate-binding protein